jgi:hypothetical protein
MILCVWVCVGVWVCVCSVCSVCFVCFVRFVCHHCFIREALRLRTCIIYNSTPLGRMGFVNLEICLTILSVGDLYVPGGESPVPLLQCVLSLFVAVPIAQEMCAEYSRHGRRRPCTISVWHAASTSSASRRVWRPSCLEASVGSVGSPRAWMSARLASTRILF